MKQEPQESVALLKALMADMPSGVTIVTTLDGDGDPSGATLSAVMSLSLDPPLMLAAFDRRSNTLKDLQAVGKPFLIHILSGEQADLAMRFAGKGDAKFEGVAWTAGYLDTPQIEGASGVIACHVAEIIPGGDHVMIIGAVQNIHHDSTNPTLLYHRRSMFSTDRFQELAL
ncbi:flavin reductase family protein [Agrobacterium sp. LAD9]|uniref:flavin reductase family protein n=1 Tax=Agrobacterium sp. LAD9 TaxID=2055153 RepID=UPI000D1E071E|nr:flavin reductase family protein [Agrobacterium sp. LAD9]